jgi:hypothetical protein
MMFGDMSQCAWRYYDKFWPCFLHLNGLRSHLRSVFTGWRRRQVGEHSRFNILAKRTVVYYESMKRNLLKPIYECWCNGRLQTKRFTRLAHTGLVVELEDLKIKMRLTNEKFASVKGECEI